MRKKMRTILALSMLAGFVLSVNAQESVLLTMREGFVRAVDVKNKTLDVSVRKNGRQWDRIPFHRIKAVYLNTEKSETWSEWAIRKAKRIELPPELPVYDPKMLHESGAHAANYADIENLAKVLQPGKSYVRVLLHEEVPVK